MEKYKDIPGYEDCYSISDNGNVFSKKNGRELIHCVNPKNKIHNVKLSKNGIVKTFSVTRLMAMTFIHNPNPKLYNYAINKTSDFDNFTIQNILWATSSIQVNRKYERHPEVKKAFKDKAVHISSRKMTDEMELGLFKMRDLGYSAKQLSDIFPIKKSQIFNLLKKRERSFLK